MKQQKNGNCNPSEMGGGREGSLLYSSVNINVLCCSPLHRTANAIRFLFLPNQCQGSPLLKAASQHPRARLSDLLSLITFRPAFTTPHCAHPLVEKVSRSKNAAEISVPLQGPKSAAAQMLKFTKSRPQHTHPRHQGGKGGRRLRLSSVCHRGCRCHIPHSGNADPS